MAEAAISFAVENLGNLLIQQVGFLQDVKQQVRDLQSELEMMQIFLKDAAEKQANDERVRHWVSQIREVAHDAEDAIEMYVLKGENARRGRGLLGSCCYPKDARSLKEIGKEIKSIRERLQDINERHERYGIRSLDMGVDLNTRSSENVDRQRLLAPWEKDKDVVGLEKDVQSLLEKEILEERTGLSVAAIVGMGGIGKSTLARKIYNHAAVAARFECRAWVVVSSEFAPEDIVKQIMVQLPNSTEDKLKVLETTKRLEESTKEKLFLQEKLKDMLYKQLEGKRYFIVLDDVWEHTLGIPQKCFP